MRQECPWSPLQGSMSHSWALGRRSGGHFLQSPEADSTML